MKKKKTLLKKILFLTILLGVNLNYAQSCSSISQDGNFSYEAQENGSETSIVFTPLTTGTGSEILLFFYSTDPNTTPGSNGSNTAVPNQPFLLNDVSSGDTVTFYYVYNEGTSTVERNSLVDNFSFTAGSCGGLSNKITTKLNTTNINTTVTNGFLDFNNLRLDSTIKIFDSKGILVKNTKTNQSNISLNLTGISKGIYMVLIEDDYQSVYTKIIIQ